MKKYNDPKYYHYKRHIKDLIRQERLHEFVFPPQEGPLENIGKNYDTFPSMLKYLERFSGYKIKLSEFYELIQTIIRDMISELTKNEGYLA